MYAVDLRGVPVDNQDVVVLKTVWVEMLPRHALAQAVQPTFLVAVTISMALVRGLHPHLLPLHPQVGRLRAGEVMERAGLVNAGIRGNVKRTPMVTVSGIREGVQAEEVGGDRLYCARCKLLLQ
ncbi:hypothetical protein A2803_00825 [Candidatus Woesebacteria bacterium RIFCSPHIGHO2_01_FULL_44_21]|uniref:Uncharacterized protein n=1 Tax=Candidatus Woesebacteria bacterium RIFCSPHIGHO2_01_FULL_44_21 TaxID=1802503 RepID=A0A1F7YXN7_9BACT|nr:MAG: hypothetical protein A2803_00825 [Candidatus Woesebacteria bacterium RIFCSPHIGHO2_01_FULL_44_21]OGM70045.1 MAG: hypothetical protein A2897_00010 [Candidatus Woesebacteria bacterium RIFCSPLOWO2_01_FULL_44_24b]